MLVYVCIRTDLILTISAHWPLSGRQIFEDFRALRAQANFDSIFGKSLFTPMGASELVGGREFVKITVKSYRVRFHKRLQISYTVKSC